MKKRGRRHLVSVYGPAARRILCLLVLVGLWLPVALMLCRSSATKTLALIHHYVCIASNDRGSTSITTTSTAAAPHEKET